MPIFERTVTLPRKHVSPVWTRSYPASRKPGTIGEHLRKRRFQLGLRQTQVADTMDVSQRTLSCWECNRIYPTWPYQPRIASFLGYDPFADPAVGMPRSNETFDVAVFAALAPESLQRRLWNHRLKHKKTRTECANELGVSIKTFQAWERGARAPIKRLKARLETYLGPPEP